MEFGCFQIAIGYITQIICMELNSCLCCVCVCGVLLCVFCVIQQKDIYVINLACPNPNMCKTMSQQTALHCYSV